MSGFAIAVDLGGSNVRMGVISETGEVSERFKEPSGAAEGCEVLIGKLTTLLKERVRFAGKGLRGVGVAVPGIVNHAAGVVVEAPNLPGWHDVPLREMLEKALNVPVFIDNDANSFACGESWLGAGKGLGHFIGITLGTGIGGGIIVDGRIVRGADGMAGEVGHLTVNIDGPRCNCGNYGCLETYASASGISDRMREAIEAGGKSSLFDSTGGNLYKITSEMVYTAARQGGDPLSREVMRSMGTYLGVGIANLIHILNPQAIILGGGVTAAWDIFADVVQKEVEKRCFAKQVERPSWLMRGTLGDDAGLVGVARIVLDA